MFCEIDENDQNNNYNSNNNGDNNNNNPVDLPHNGAAKTVRYKPSANNFSEENFTYLRNALLLALSTVTAQNGSTPQEVIHSELTRNNEVLAQH